MLEKIGTSTTAVYAAYSFLSLAGTLMIAALNPLASPPSPERFGETSVPLENAFSVQEVLSMPLRERRLLLLFPLVNIVLEWIFYSCDFTLFLWGFVHALWPRIKAIYQGSQAAFMWGAFTAFFVKPTLGTNNIGYVMAVSTNPNRCNVFR